MIAFIRDLWAVMRNHRKLVLLSMAGVVGFCIILAGFFQYKTTQSTFCNSCHYMDPYVRHWQASTHADVECVECHDYPVSRLTLSALKYITGTYDSRPKANVRDEHCLESGCHDSQLLGGKTEYRNRILFDHTVHLEKPLRGEKLRCSSCHNQIVQYEDEQTQTHMTVNDMACFVCHFKDAGVGEAITGCDACHGMPETEVEHAGFSFQHAPYLELGVDCKQCHTRIVIGDGAVPPTKCYSCHVERERAEHSREELHAIHVTENGIDCFRCHSDIEHGNFEMVSALDIRCESCHLRQHNKQKQLYMGIGGKDVHEIPSAMFAAQVSCAGCHTDLTPEGELPAGQSKKEPERAACVACHGKGYDLMFDDWRSGSRKVLKEYKAYLVKAGSDLRVIGGSRKARTKVREALSSAESNYNFVREGHIPHNIQYSLAMLNASADSLDRALTTIDKAYKPASRGSSLDPANSCRTFCHGTYLRPETVNYDGDELPHELHVEDMELACSSCHPTEEHGRTSVNEDVCSECH